MTDSAESDGGIGALARQAAKAPLVTTSLLGLFLVSIKILSVVNWNASSALAILSTSDSVALLSSSLLSLMPAFVAFLIAGTTLWWTTSIQEDNDRPVIVPHPSLLVLAGLAVIAPFSMPYLAYVPVVLAGSVLVGFLFSELLVPEAAQFTMFGRTTTGPGAQKHDRHTRRWRDGLFVAMVTLIYLLPMGIFWYTLSQANAAWPQYLAVIGLLCAGLALAVFGWHASRNGSARMFHVKLLRMVAVVTATVILLTVLVLGVVWMPPERIVLTTGTLEGVEPNLQWVEGACAPNSTTMCDTITGYILENDGKNVTFLTDTSRAIIHLPGGSILSHQICSPQPHSAKWLLLLQRPTQVATGSASTLVYEYCPYPPP